ncbi:methionyl-tRNA formyltransferase [uncultured Winogradskyella sp.]|uniref:methionyl-tRNA formyltransferase n=1 Tax=uncultured Winogradskyella sp. TaxID=395353 RepID=UPI00260A6A32|nr:methionyl-tRNA formyltransferase [uncultured Winogradskyella sp.]
MRIVFCGEDRFSAQVLESLIFDEHQILAVFCPSYDNHIHTRLKLICEKYFIDFYRIKDINSKTSETTIKALNPDLIVVCHFEKILKKNIIEIPHMGCINLHPSLLPNYRGLSPQHWPIINGEDETGITVHFINEGIDTGDIIVQQKMKIEPNIYVSDLQIKMLGTYKCIVKDAIKLLAEQKVEPSPQHKSKGSYYGKLKKDQCHINLNNGYVSAYNLIRGVSKPYFGARLNQYQIWKASVAPKAVDEKIQSKYKRNDIYFDEVLGALIKFNDGSLIVEKYNATN